MLLAILILGLSACSESPALAYARGLHAETYADAFSACGGAGDLESDCKTATIERFQRYEDCDRMPQPGECHFRHAEVLGQGGAVREGIQACAKAGPYAGECDEHLLGMLAMMGHSPQEAADAFATVEPDLRMGDARMHFYRIWFRYQLNQGIRPDLEQCPDLACKRAGRQTFRAARMVEEESPVEP